MSDSVVPPQLLDHIIELDDAPEPVDLTAPTTQPLSSANDSAEPIDLTVDEEVDELDHTLSQSPEEHFKVIRILDAKKVGRVNYYRLEWDGIDLDTGKRWKPSWEPEENVSQDLVASYFRQKSTNSRKRKRRDSDDSDMEDVTVIGDNRRHSARIATRPQPAKSWRDSPRSAPQKAAAREILTKHDVKKPAARTTNSGETLRVRVKNEITATTRTRRNAFLWKHREYFEPLLPVNNYINKIDPAKVEQAVPHIELEAQPKNIKATLQVHQMAGLEFLVNMFHNSMPAILGDGMGLGKTLQTLSLIQYLEEKHPTSGELPRPYLVVCPLSVLQTWTEEAAKWAPKLKVMRFHGNVAERAQLKANASPKAGVATFDVMVTTYEAFTTEQTWFRQAFLWRYCILDEGHRIKNEKTTHSEALQGLNAEHRLLLTGTPLQNDMHELWALLHWLYPEVFPATTSIKFEESFNLTKGEVNMTFISHARRLLELIMIRRMKDSPGIDLGLPPKEEVLLYLPLTPFQRFWYTRLIVKMGDAVLGDLFGGSKLKEEKLLKDEIKEDTELAQNENGALLDGNINDFTTQSEAMIQQAIASEKSGGAETETAAYKKLMNLLMQLRKCCSHPYQVKGAAPDPYLLGDHLMHASSKFVVLSKIIDELVLQKGKKIIIFSGFTSVLDYCEDLMLLKGSNQFKAPFHYVRFDGGTARARTNLQVRLFNDPKSDYKVMLISTRAGGLGLNLAAACSDVVFMDDDWNPQVTVQAESRAHRIGQTKPVTIYKLATQGTVEEQMMGRIRKKLYLSAKITHSMRDMHSKRKRDSGLDDTQLVDDDAPQLGMTQLKSLLRRGAATLSHDEIDVKDMVSWDLDTIIKKCRDKTAESLAEHKNDEEQKNDEDDTVTEESWLAKMERVECAVFDGVKYQRQLEADMKAPTEMRREDRRVGKNTTVMVGGFAIDKQSMLCADWEAVPTLAGKDPRLAEPKREKAKPIEHQEHCQTCFDGGELITCSGCPRSYHFECLSHEYQLKANAAMNFFCPQHNCAGCNANTSNAGGLMYRCRWCANGWCEDCADWKKAKLLGETLPEYETLGHPTKSNAWYIECHGCVEEMEANEKWAKFVAENEAALEEQYEAFAKREEEDKAGLCKGLLEPEVATAETPTKITTAADVEMEKKMKREKIKKEKRSSMFVQPKTTTAATTALPAARPLQPQPPLPLPRPANYTTTSQQSPPSGSLRAEDLLPGRRPPIPTSRLSASPSFGNNATFSMPSSFHPISNQPVSQIRGKPVYNTIPTSSSSPPSAAPQLQVNRQGYASVFYNSLNHGLTRSAPGPAAPAARTVQGVIDLTDDLEDDDDVMIVDAPAGREQTLPKVQGLLGGDQVNMKAQLGKGVSGGIGDSGYASRQSPSSVGEAQALTAGDMGEGHVDKKVRIA